jgi:micrococcal nuclease
VVTKVIDGDTIHVLINGVDYKVRYIGMNAPEDTTKKEWLGPEATARDKELVAGKTVTWSKMSLKLTSTGDCCASFLWTMCS